MLGKKILTMRKLTKKVKGVGGASDPNNTPFNESLLKGYNDELDQSPNSNNNTTTTPIGYFAIYVGEEHQRYVVPTSYLSHPLFKILLEKAHNEFGFAQRNGLVVPCSVSTFQEVVNAIECNNGKFDLGKIFEEFR